MLAAMPPTPPTSPLPGEPPVRDRGDACPGALRLHSADDGRLARLRLPAGLLTVRQAQVLASVAEGLGDGRISVTSRGNVELRGLGEGCGAELAEVLADAGLLPSATHERIRNVVASPTAGLDGLGCGDVQLWARELDALLCGREWTAALSGRFLFVLDDGRGDVAGLGGDVTLVAGETSVRLRVGDQVFAVAPVDAPRAALAAAGAFLDAAHAAGNGAWRVRELPGEHVPGLAEALAAAGVPAEPVPAPTPPRTAAPPPAPGLLGEHALHVLTPLGRLTAAHLRALAESAAGGENADGTEKADSAKRVDNPANAAASHGELRLTPWRGVVVTGFADRAAARERLAVLDTYGLITDPRSPWAGVGACTGRPGCAKSLADVRADATPGHGGAPEHDATPGHTDATPGHADAPGGLPVALPVHFSGCERRCGHPQAETWVDVVATGEGTYLVDGRPTPRTDLPDAVAAARTPSATTR
ncbi:cobalamin biosynthesis protein CobG [Streptomyces sp. NPDC090127]|uniref:cobalamin biosynthesis protein CobG n=1 Tax=Streptomyces sp. NPDC090127 TaxID=3365953 RepID=UPI0038234F75